jgi:hypothetical protein
MNGVVAGLLAALLVLGFARPRWWLGLVPVAVAVGLGAYRLSVSSSADAVAFLGIVLLAIAMEGSVASGVLARAAFERTQARPTGATLRAARAVALTGLAFIGAALVAARASAGVTLVLSVAALGLVLARAWRARLGRGISRARPASAPTLRRARADTRRPRADTRRSRAASSRRVRASTPSSRGARRGSR